MRPRLFAIVSILLGLTFPLVALEVALRVATPEWLNGRMTELTAGSSYEYGTDQEWPVIRQNGAFRQFVPLSSFVARHYEYEHTVAIDERGGRSTLYSSDNGRYIPFLGDSITFGVGVRDSETFVSVIGVQSSLRILNLGVPGSALHSQLNIIEARHFELGKPEAYVLFMFMGNDLADIRKHYEQSMVVKTDDAPTSEHDFLWHVNDYVFHNSILKRSYAIQFVRQKLLIIMSDGGADLINPIFHAMRTDTNYLEESIGYLRTELIRLMEISDRLQFAFAIVLIPDIHQVSPMRLKLKSESIGLDVDNLDPKRVSREISDVMRELGISYVDISECISRSDFPDTLYYVQDNHLTAEGHRVAATCMLRQRLIKSVTN